MKLQKFSQSTFVIENVSGTRLLIDPGKYNFDQGFRVEDFGRIDILVVTHKHEDHFYLEAVKSIVNLHRPTILTNPELSVVLQNQTIGNTIVHVGDKFDIKGFVINCIKTDHVVRGESIANFGIVVEADNRRIYHTSDTRLMEMSELPQEAKEPDVLCVPISNRGVVMGIDDALYFTNDVKPKVVIPIHYDSPKDKARVRPEHFVDRAEVLKDALGHLSKVQIKVLGFGDEITFE